VNYKIPILSELLLTYFTTKWFVPRVDASVIRERLAMHEAYVADTTHEKFLASVDTCVCHERCTSCKSFTTDFTAEALVCGVYVGVTNKTGTLCEQLLTHITLERSNSSCKTFYSGFSAAYFRDKWHVWMKGTRMVCKGVTVAEPSVAYLTAVRFITCVGAHMDHKVMAKPERLIAHLTDKGLFTCMDASMYS